MKIKITKIIHWSTKQKQSSFNKSWRVLFREEHFPIFFSFYKLAVLFKFSTYFMMQLVYIIFLVLNFIVIAIHLIAITLLLKVRCNRRNKTQAYLITMLCFSELSYSVTYVLSICFTKLGNQENPVIVYMIRLVEIISVSFLAVIYYPAMMLVTVDRFFVFRLNVKYSLLWSPKKTLKLISGLFILAAFVFLIYLIKDFVEPILSFYYIPYIYVGLDTMFIIIAAVTYIYIFKVFKNHRRKKKKSVVRSTKDDSFNLYVPTWIIITFLIFIVIPNYLRFFNSMGLIQLSVGVNVVSQYMYLIGYLADPLIYIAHLPFARQKIRRYRNRIRNKINQEIWKNSKI